jgi:hypothetical protein
MQLLEVAVASKAVVGINAEGEIYRLPGSELGPNTASTLRSKRKWLKTRWALLITTVSPVEAIQLWMFAMIRQKKYKIK